jgi:uncharacterized protein (DUF849 family)
MSMERKTIVTCAVTGNLTRPEQHPGLPITPAQIAQAALDAAAAGAAVVHLHVRDPISGRGSMDLALYEELVGRIRECNSEVILNLTTGEGGRFVPDDIEPRLAANGTTLCAPELRVAHVEKLKTPVCTLDLNTMWSGQAAVINSPRNVTMMAQRIYAAGVKPEIEIFDSGDLQLAAKLIEDSILRAPLLVQFVLGVRYGAAANPQTLAYLVGQLPPGSIWGAFGIGRHEFPMVAQSFLLGGHVRVGMEDNLFIRKGELCRDNAQLVEKAVRIVEDLGGCVASVGEARRILGL